MHEAVATYADVVVERAARLRDAWTGDVVDVFDAMRDLTADVVIRCLSADVDDREAEPVVRAIATQASWFWRLFVPFSTTIERIPLRANRELRRARLTVEGSVAHQIDRARRRDREGMLATILASPDPSSGGTMSDELAAAEAISLLFGGRAGPGSGLAWTWLALSRHPEAEASMHREIDDAPRGPDRDIRGSATSAVHPDGVRRGAPTISAGVDREAPGRARSAPPRPSRAGGRTPAGQPLRRAPRPSVPPRSRTLRPRAVRTGAADRPASVRVLPVRRRRHGMPRRALRVDGGTAGARHDRPTLAPSTTSSAEPAFASFISLKPRSGLRMRPEQRDAGRTGS